MKKILKAGKIVERGRFLSVTLGTGSGVWDDPEDPRSKYHRER